MKRLFAWLMAHPRHVQLFVVTVLLAALLATFLLPGSEAVAGPASSGACCP